MIKKVPRLKFFIWIRILWVGLRTMIVTGPLGVHHITAGNPCSDTWQVACGNVADRKWFSHGYRRVFAHQIRNSFYFILFFDSGGDPPFGSKLIGTSIASKKNRPFWFSSSIKTANFKTQMSLHPKITLGMYYHFHQVRDPSSKHDPSHHYWSHLGIKE